MAGSFVAWERERLGVTHRFAEARAATTESASTGATLRGYADRIDVRPAGMADIIDFKTGLATRPRDRRIRCWRRSLRSKRRFWRAARSAISARAMPAELAYVRLRPNGEVDHDPIHEFKKETEVGAGTGARTRGDRLEKLVAHYQRPEAGYLSRALPFKEGDVSGDYDHLARVLEWSAGGDEGGGEE